MSEQVLPEGWTKGTGKFAGKIWNGKKWIPDPSYSSGDAPQIDSTHSLVQSVKGVGELRQDIAEAAETLTSKLGVKRELRKLIEYLWDGETVSSVVSGYYGKSAGLLVFTNRRILFVQDGATGSRSEDFLLDKVSSIQFSSGLALGTITIFASGNKAAIENVNKTTGKIFVDKVRGVLGGKSSGTANPHSGNDNVSLSPIEQLEKLGALYQAGLLSDEEFAAKKAALLDQI